MEIRPILSALLRNKTGAILVALQVALSMAILANALHIVNERRAVAARPSGLGDEHSVFSIEASNLAGDTAEQQIATMNREIATLRSVPGVLSVANVNQMPMSNSGNYNGVSLDRKQVRESTNVAMYASPDSLVQTWGLKLVEGRDFGPQDQQDLDLNSDHDHPRLAILSKPLAEKLWPGQGATGRTMYIGVGEDAMELRVVGVVERLQTPDASVSERGEFSMQVPVRFVGSGPSDAMYTVRTAPGQRDRVMKDAEQALRHASATPVIITEKTVDEQRHDRYRSDVALSWMLVTVSVLLLLVTSSGIVGMASLWVTQRRKQIGVRRALGARRIDVLRYFITENFLITSAGVFGGVLLGVALNQLLVSKLEMARLPLGYLAGGAAVFWLLGVIAAYGPAWRAASISPATATRST